MQVSEPAKPFMNATGPSLELILQSSTDGFLFIDPDFRVVFANRSACHLFDLAEDQLVGSRLSDLLRGIDVDALLEIAAQGQESAAWFRADSTCVTVKLFRVNSGFGVWVRPTETDCERALKQRLASVSAQADAVADSMRSGLILVDGDGSLLKVNPVAVEMFGAPNARVEQHVPGFEFSDMQGDKLAREDWPLERALRGETARDLDLQVLPTRGNGEPWIASFNTQCIYDDSGKVRYAVAIIRDVSGVRETERALHESETRHTVAMEAAHLGTWSRDLKRNELHWSDRCRTLNGLEPGTPVEFESYSLTIHKEDREKVAASTADCLARPGELIEVEYRVHWPDGSVHWLQSWKQSRVGEDGQPELITGAVANIDDRKAVESELHRTAGALRAIIDGSPMGIVATDGSGVVKIWNPAAEKTLGFKRHEVIGKASPLLLGSWSQTQDREYRVARADGREIEILCSVAPIDGEHTAHGGRNDNGSIAMFLDITERQRFRRRAEHGQKMESLSVLAGGVAHDFNNLLTGILGNASLCLYSTQDTDERYELLQEIMRSGDRAAALTRQLLAFTGQGRFSVSPLGLGDLARKVASSAQLPNRLRPISVQFDLEPRMPLVEADAGQLQQAILSLIMNSAEAIDDERPGNIWIRTRTESIPDGAVAVGESGETLPTGRYAVLEVEDTGAGMGRQTLARIFEPFFSTKFTGRGLGLPAVLGIVRQHRGAITAKSTPGAGSIFRVYLPVVPEQQPLIASPHNADTLQGAGQILVVDDEETVRTTIRRSLERWGYQVILAENGQAAVDVFPELAPQLSAVFLDLTMPVMGGEEALGHFRRIRPYLPVILISGYEDTHLARASFDVASSFLQKPFTPEQLSQKLMEVLAS